MAYNLGRAAVYKSEIKRPTCISNKYSSSDFCLISRKCFDSFFSLLDGVGQEGCKPVRSGIVTANHMLDGLKDVIICHLHHSLSEES